MQGFGLIENDAGIGKELEEAMIGAGHGSVELPAGENSGPGIAGGLLDHLGRSANALAGETRVDRAEQLNCDRSFRKREKQGFIHWVRRALAGGIELAHGFDLVSEELDAHGAIGFGRIDIENTAASGVLAGHFDDIGRGVADGV